MPPPDHMPAAVAALYLIASILHEDTNRPAAERCQGYLAARRLPRAGLKSVSGMAISNFDMVSTGFVVTASPDHPNDPYQFGGVRMQFHLRPPPQPRRRLLKGTVVSQVERPPPMTLTLVPPYQDCLGQGTIRKNLSRGLRGIDRPIPKGSIFTFPDFAVQAVAKFRYALANGAIRAILVEETGEVTPVPSAFWRTHDGEAALRQDAPVSVSITERTARGQVYLAITDLQRGWRSIVELAAPVVEHLATDVLPSPWMVYMQEVAAEFAYSDGRTLRNTRYTKAEIVRHIKTTWPVAKFGPFSASAASFLARFIRHPDDENLGKPDEREARAIARRKPSEAKFNKASQKLV